MSQHSSGLRSHTPPRTRRPPSLSPRRGRRRDAGQTPQCVVREVGSANYPILTRTNYVEWAVLMQVMLEARDLWEVVDTGGVDRHEDRMAMEAILRATPSEMRVSLHGKGTAKRAWDAIKIERVGVDRIRKAKATNLLREFDALTFRDGETIDDFTHRLSNIVSELSILGDPLGEPAVVRKILQAVPPRFDQIAHSIETLLDVDEMTQEELVGRLKSAEVRDRSRARRRQQAPPASCCSPRTNGRPATNIVSCQRDRTPVAATARRPRAVSVREVVGTGSGVVPAATPATHRENPPRRTSASTAARKAIGPVNAARRSATKRRTSFKLATTTSHLFFSSPVSARRIERYAAHIAVNGAILPVIVAGKQGRKR